MHSDKSETEPRSPNRVLIASIALLVIALALAVFCIVQPRAAALQKQNGFVLLEGENAYFASAGNGLAAVTSSGAQLFSSAGKCVAELDGEYTSPRCAASSKSAVFYEPGEAAFSVLYPDGSSCDSAAEGGILAADVNDSGLLTVITEREGMLGCVMVYDTDLTALFRLTLSSMTPSTARTSADGVLCVCGTTDTGSALRFYRIDSEEQTAEFAVEGETFLDLGFLSDGTVAAVTDRALYFVGADGTLTASHRFDGAEVSAYSFGSDRAAIAVKGDEKTEIGMFSAAGETLGRSASERDVLAMSVYGEQVLVLFSGSESALYTSELEELICCQPREDVHQVFLCAESRALYAGASGIMQIDFGQ